MALLDDMAARGLRPSPRTLTAALRSCLGPPNTVGSKADGAGPGDARGGPARWREAVDVVGRMPGKTLTSFHLSLAARACVLSKEAEALDHALRLVGLLLEDHQCRQGRGLHDEAHHDHDHGHGHGHGRPHRQHALEQQHEQLSEPDRGRGAHHRRDRDRPPRRVAAAATSRAAEEERVALASTAVGLMEAGRVEEACTLLGLMRERGLAPSRRDYASLLRACRRHGGSELTLQVFRSIPARARDVFHFSAVMAACAWEGRLDEVLALDRDMQAAGIPRDAHVVTAVVLAFSSANALPDGVRWMAELPEDVAAQHSVATAAVHSWVCQCT